MSQFGLMQSGIMGHPRSSLRRVYTDRLKNRNSRYKWPTGSLGSSIIYTGHEKIGHLYFDGEKETQTSITSQGGQMASSHFQ